MSFLSKTGLDSLNIAGHKVPIALVGGVAAIAGVLLVIRARKTGSNVASVGQPNQGVNPVIDTFGSQGFSPDFGGQLSNIEQGLAGIQQTINGTPPTSNTGSPYETRNDYLYYTASGSEDDAARAIAAQFGGNVSDIKSRLDFFDPNGALNGKWYYPVNVPGYRAEDLPFLQRLVVR